MGSQFSRNLRDIFEATGCDGIAPLDTSQSDVNDAFNTAKDSASQQSNPRPVTPVPRHRTRLLSQDPRSPSYGIIRTPIEVVATPSSDKPKRTKVETGSSEINRNYLETDLDSFEEVKAYPSTPVLSANHKLPPGLSASHLLKLKFLGMDPRSPSEGIPRTPIQVLVPSEKRSKEDISKEMDTSSVSLSRSLFGSSEESLDISKACSEPSAFVSDYDQSRDWSFALASNELEQEEVASSVSVEDEVAAENELKSDISEASSNQSRDTEESVSIDNSEEVDLKRNEELVKEISLLAGKISQNPFLNKPSSEVHIFCEDSTKTPQNTPKKKSTRTPLTPICNLTPSDGVRAKKIPGKHLGKKKIVCKVLSGCENTPTKQTGLLKKGKKPQVDENAKLGEWDHDTTIII